VECSSRSVEFCFRRRRKPSGCRDRPSGFVLHGVVGDSWGPVVTVLDEYEVIPPRSMFNMFNIVMLNLALFNLNLAILNPAV